MSLCGIISYRGIRFRLSSVPLSRIPPSQEGETDHAQISTKQRIYGRSV